ncbi:hypothetical protein Ancab_034188 [Ancistrocladus abbreviatus]
MEVLALRFALLAIKTLHLHSVLLEIHSLQLAREWSADPLPKNELGLLIEDAKSVAKASGSGVLIFCSREANKVAHTMAKLALCLSEDTIWVGDFPKEITTFVNQDALY